MRYDWEESRKVFEVYKVIYTSKKIAVKDIAKRLGRSVQTVSNQITPLRKAGMIKATIEGRNKYYSPNEEKLLIYLAAMKITKALIWSIKASANFKTTKSLNNLDKEDDSLIPGIDY